MASRTASLLPNMLRRQARLPSTTRLVAPSAWSSSPRASFQPSLLPTRSTAIRLAHSIPRPPPITPRDPSSSASSDAADNNSNNQPASESPRPSIPANNQQQPYYQLSFTCVPCGHRSHHNVSKQGYHRGSTLITCPECRNRHVISDHLGIFGDRKVTVEELLREKGQLVKRGSLGEDGDIEFWPDDGAEDGVSGTGNGS